MKLNLTTDMEMLVVGAGASGIAAAKMLRTKGFSVRLLEKNVGAIPSHIEKMLHDMGVFVLYGDFLPFYADQVECIVLSPGIPAQGIYDIVHSRGMKKNPYIIGEIELGYTFLDDEPIIAITGTAGKTTTATITARLLEKAGLNVFLGGNIGTPLCEYILLGEKADVLVLELSSFQLQTVRYFRPKVACLLNISPNHLDYHATMEEYTQAKMNMFKRQSKEDFALLTQGVLDTTQAYSIPSIQRSIDSYTDFSPKYLLGEHNRENIEIAYQASRIFGVRKEDAYEVINNFSSLPHRLEYVAVKKGVTYINDSKSTTVESLLVALEAMDSPTILLAGGKFKGGDVYSLRGCIQEKVKEIILFGASRDIFEMAWKDTAPITYVSTLLEAVELAKTKAVTGDTVLLSPATSSFDAFSSYIERGEAFKKAVLGGIDIEE